MLRTIEGVCWPIPGADLSALILRLSLGTADQEDCSIAALAIESYVELIDISCRKRENVIRELRMESAGLNHATE